MRIGISGTNWTGKTTTVDTFCARHQDYSIARIALKDLVERSPFPMMENQTPDGSRWITEQLSPLLESAGPFTVFDRCPLDVLAFSLYSFERNEIAPEDVLVRGLIELAQRFDVLFYCSPSDEWPPVAFPGTAKVGFALLMDWYMRRAIRTYGLEARALPWSLADRQRVLDRLLPAQG